MKFFLGIAAGALGMWAYQNGKLDSLKSGNMPDSMRQAWQPAAERFNQVANSDTVRQATSRAQSAMQGTGGTPDIATPSASEVSGRPSEPLPTSGA